MPIPRPASKAVAAGEISISTPAVRRVRRRVFRALGFGGMTGFAPISLDTNDPDTIRCGLEKRLCRDLPEVTDAKIAKLKSFTRDWCAKNLPHVSVMPFEEWLESTSYTESRKADLRLAHATLRGGAPNKREASKVSTFGKTQAYPKYAHCRLINTRSDKVKCFLGPRFKPVEDALYSRPEFIKHVPVAERPARIATLRKALRRYFLTDYEAFESHFVDKIMDAVECELYRWCLANDVYVDLVCDILTGFNVLKTRSGVRARLKGRRMSGDMCTSLGNGFTNLMLTLFVASEAGGYVEGFVEGDDGIFSSTVALTPEMYRELGFSIKIVEVESPCTSVPVGVAPTPYGVSLGAFCGVACTDAGEIVRDPRAFACKFGWTSTYINAGPKIMAQLARAHALSAVYEAPQCPVIGAIARRVLRETAGTVARFDNDGYHIPPSDMANIPEFEPKLETRELFARLYGVPVSAQIMIEGRVLAGGDDVTDLMQPTPDMAHYCARYVEG